MSVKRRVSRGVKWLDKNEPGWRDNVNSKVNIRYMNTCVLAQVFDEGGFPRFMRKYHCPGMFWGMRRGFLSLFRADAFNREWERRVHDSTYKPRKIQIRRAPEREKVVA